MAATPDPTTRSSHSHGQHRGAPRAVRLEVADSPSHFGPVQAVSDLSFTVEPGSVTGFLGPNGAGKTTTLRMVLGLMNPDAGTATFDGTPYAALPDPLRTVGAVLETPSTRRGRAATTCGSTAGPRAPGVPGRRGAVQVGLADAGDRRAGGYSLGMRQRLALATALLGDPAVLVLDEPANGLDPEGIQWLRGFLRHLAHEQGRTILVSSHLLSEVEQTVDRVVIVGAGRLVREGSMEQLRSGADGAGTVLVRGPEMGRLAEVLTAAGAASPSPTASSPSPAHARGDRPPRLRRRRRAARAAVAHQRARGDLLPAHQRPGAVRRPAPGTPLGQEATR